jgi:hypothetical protein
MKPGGGRKRTAEQDEMLVRDLESLIEPLSLGDPESALHWTCKSVRKLAQDWAGVVTPLATVWWLNCYTTLVLVTAAQDIFCRWAQVLLPHLLNVRRT